MPRPPSRAQHFRHCPPEGPGALAAGVTAPLSKSWPGARARLPRPPMHCAKQGRVEHSAKPGTAASFRPTHQGCRHAGGAQQAQAHTPPPSGACRPAWPLPLSSDLPAAPGAPRRTRPGATRLHSTGFLQPARALPRARRAPGGVAGGSWACGLILGQAPARPPPSPPPSQGRTPPRQRLRLGRKEGPSSGAPASRLPWRHDRSCLRCPANPAPGAGYCCALFERRGRLSASVAAPTAVKDQHRLTSSQ
jgi:hypothetical protein